MFDRIPWTLAVAVCVTCFLAGCNRILGWVDAATDTRLEWTKDVPLSNRRPAEGAKGLADG